MYMLVGFSLCFVGGTKSKNKDYYDSSQIVKLNILLLWQYFCCLSNIREKYLTRARNSTKILIRSLVNMQDLGIFWISYYKGYFASFLIIFKSDGYIEVLTWKLFLPTSSALLYIIHGILRKFKFNVFLSKSQKSLYSAMKMYQIHSAIPRIPQWNSWIYSQLTRMTNLRFRMCLKWICIQKIG